jgi:predicted nucleic acid-binding protein
MELLQGCRNQQEMVRLEKFLKGYTIYWPTAADSYRALNDLSNNYLAQGLRMLDALIGECAVGLNVPLCTFNKKHFNAISSLKIIEPYAKKAPSLPATNP